MFTLVIILVNIAIFFDDLLFQRVIIYWTTFVQGRGMLKEIESEWLIITW